MKIALILILLCLFIALASMLQDYKHYAIQIGQGIASIFFISLILINEFTTKNK